MTIPYKLLVIVLCLISISVLLACRNQQKSRETALIADLVTKNPHPNAVLLFDYLRSIYGEKMISGQMDLTWNDRVNMVQRVYKDTEKYPALQGFDFMNFKGTGSGTMQTEEAMIWWENAAGTGQNGIVTFCWHWRDPTMVFDRGEFYSRETGFRIPWDFSTDSWKSDSPEYQAMIRDIDRVARQLKRLEEAGVPVLWRPLHEASGGWFWWGASGEEAYLALWQLLFEKLNNEHGLTNLIWVWNGQNRRWYPGDETVDIIGEDVYSRPRDYHSMASRFRMAKRIPEQRKMIALTENGTIPHPDNMAKDNVHWLYFMTWNDSKGPENEDRKDSFWTGEYHNEQSHKMAVYHHPDVITLLDLPRFVQDEKPSEPNE